MFARIENGIVAELVPAITAQVEESYTENKKVKDKASGAEKTEKVTKTRTVEKALYHESLKFVPADKSVEVGMAYDEAKGKFSKAEKAEDPTASIRAQIRTLEAKQTPRRLREAILTEEGAAWLADIESQITALRAQLS